MNKDKVEYVKLCWPILEGFLENTNYLCGNELTIADFCCIASVCSFDALIDIDYTKYPKVLAWKNRIAELPYYESLCAKGGKLLQNVVLQKLEANRKL